jgi:hypothetical protein
VRLEGLGQLKKSTSSGTRTGDFPACSIVPQPTTLSRAPMKQMFLKIFMFENKTLEWKILNRQNTDIHDY